jgi:hypothetical protein
MQNIYQNPTIDLLANTEEDYKILSKIWKEPLGVLHDYNYKELISIISKI